MGTLCGPQGGGRQNTATRFLLAVTGSTRAKAAIPEITTSSWAGVVRGSANSLCSPPIRYFAHLVCPSRGFLAFACCPHTPQAFEQPEPVVVPTKPLLPCFFLVPHSIALLRLPYSFFSSSSVLHLVTRYCRAPALRQPTILPSTSPFTTCSAPHEEHLVSIRWPIPSPKNPFVL